MCMLYPSYILLCSVYLKRQIGGEGLRKAAGAGSCNVLLLFCSSFSAGFQPVISVL